MAIVEKIVEGVTTGGIGLFGGASYYLYLVSKGRRFNLGMFVINLFLAFFIGYVVGQFIPTNAGYHDGLIAISGFCSFPILDILDKKGALLISKYLGVGPTEK